MPLARSIRTGVPLMRFAKRTRPKGEMRSALVAGGGEGGGASVKVAPMHDPADLIDVVRALPIQDPIVADPEPAPWFRTG